MKRSWIGLGILAALLVICLGVGCLMCRGQMPIAWGLSQAAEFGADQDWEKALPLFQDAKTRWERNRHWVACVADHTPMEEIDALFAQLSQYAIARDEEEFAAGCAALAKKAEAMADAHGLSVWGFL